MTTVVVNPDGSLPLARQQLHDAVSLLVDPRPARVGDHYRWEPALYSALRTELSGSQPLRRSGIRVQRSRAPLRLDVLQLLLEIDETVIGWSPDEKGTTVERLRAVTVRTWRPQDTSVIEHHVDEIRRWTIAGTELLVPPVRVFLPMPCPRCGARHAYHRNSYGESVSSLVLKVSETGCVCLHCESFWPPSEFGWLARLLSSES